MSPSDWNDDEQQQPAPLPAHERIWRHPSEIGQQAWRQTEPPLAIGRGLTAATGVVGSVLGVVLLWAMLSTEAGRGAVATVRSTIVNLTGSNFGPGLTDGIEAVGTATTPPSTVHASLGTGTLPGEEPESLTKGPVPTWAVRTAPADPGTSATTDVGTAPAVLAVPVSQGALAITTAAAVQDELTVQLELPDGLQADARVLFVDDRTGLAVLAPQTSAPVESFTVATDIQPGDELTFLGDVPLTVTVAADGTIPGAWADDDTLPEGAPVVNQRGELVALCSHHQAPLEGEATGDTSSSTTSPASSSASTDPATGDLAAEAHLVTLETLDDIQRAMAAFRGTAPVWLGVVINDDPAGDLSIGAVDPSGPAHEAGLTAGDVIISIDDQDIVDGRALTAHLGMYLPGDVITLTIRHTDGTIEDILVTLAAPKASL